MNIRRLLLFTIALLMSMAIYATDIDRGTIYNRLRTLTDRQLLDKGYALLQHGEKTDNALICYTIVVNRFYDGEQSEKSTDNTIVAMENLGNIYMTRLLDYRKAYEYLIQARQLADSNGNKRHLAYIYLSLCNVWKMSMLTSGKQRDKYVATLRKAFHYAWLSDDADIAATALVALCDEALYAQSGMNMANEVRQYNNMHKPKDTQLIAYTNSFAKATMLTQKHRYAEAARAFEASANMVDTKLAPERYRYISLSNQAYVLFLSGRTSEATDSLKTLLNRATKEHTRDYAMSITHLLHNMYAQMGQHALADKYQLMYLAQKDSLTYGNNLSEISDVETSAKLNETNREMVQLAHRHHTQTIIFAFIAIIASILLMAVAIVVHAYRKLQLSYRMLYLKNEALLHQDNPKEKYKNSRLDTDEKHVLMKKITDVLENNAEIYDNAFCLNRMAELVGAGYKDVSQVVNEEYGGNFNSMLNEYRIREACRRLSDTANYGQLTIEAIARSVGFKSRTGFATLFKRFTGMTPSVYQKIASSH